MTHHPTPTPGAQCRVSGERGPFVFVRVSLSTTGKTSWYLLDDHKQFRAFRPERVTVPRKRQKQLQLEEQIA